MRPPVAAVPSWQLGVAAVPGITHGAADAGVQLLGQMLDHVAPLVPLATLTRPRAPMRSMMALRRALPPSTAHSRAWSASSPRSTGSLSSERTTRLAPVEPRDVLVASI